MDSRCGTIANASRRSCCEDSKFAIRNPKNVKDHTPYGSDYMSARKPHRTTPTTTRKHIQATQDNTNPSPTNPPLHTTEKHHQNSTVPYNQEPSCKPNEKLTIAEHVDSLYTEVLTYLPPSSPLPRRQQQKHPPFSKISQNLVLPSMARHNMIATVCAPKGEAAADHNIITQKCSCGFPRSSLLLPAPRT